MMKIIRALVKVILVIFVFILFLILAINILGTRTDIVEGITGHKIKQVKPGMTLEEVILILGRPFEIKASHGLHNLACKNSRQRLLMDIKSSTNIKTVVDKFYNDTNYCCEGNRDEMQYRAFSLTYTRPVELSKNYPMLWISFDSNYKVGNVYAKCYDGILGLDDPSIYSLSWGFNPEAMTIRNDTTEGFINEQLFNDCFHK